MRTTNYSQTGLLLTGLFIYFSFPVFVVAQTTDRAEDSKSADSSESLGDLAEDLKNRTEKGSPPPKGITLQKIDPEVDEDQPVVAEQNAITDTGMLAFLNFALKESNQPPISMDKLGSVDLGQLPREYFIVLDRQGDEASLIEWITGEFLRVREATWESWRPANKLIEKNVTRGKMVRSIPDGKFVVLLLDDGNMGSALLKIRERLWAINLSRPDGLSPVFPLVPEELFYENVRDKEKN